MTMMTMMKNVLLAGLCASSLLAGALAQDETCNLLRLTFNLQPKFPGGDSMGYDCAASAGVNQTAMGNFVIEQIIPAETKTTLTGLGYTSVGVDNFQHSGCPNFPCVMNCGHLTLPRCIDVNYCMPASMGTTMSTSHLGSVNQNVVDALRADLPNCLGVVDQFMSDIHPSAIF